MNYTSEMHEDLIAVTEGVLAAPISPSEKDEINALTPEGLIALKWVCTRGDFDPFYEDDDEAWAHGRCWQGYRARDILGTAKKLVVALDTGWIPQAWIEADPDWFESIERVYWCGSHYLLKNTIELKRIIEDIRETN